MSLLNFVSSSTRGQSASTSDEAADTLVTQGIEAARFSRRREALGFFDDALRMNPNHLEALLWRGGLSEPHAAVAYLERACAVDPSSAQAREGLQWARERINAESAQSEPAVIPESAPSEVEASSPANDQPTEEKIPEGKLNSSVAEFASASVHVLRGIAGRVVKRMRLALAVFIILLGLLAIFSAVQVGLGNDDASVMPPSTVTSSTAPVLVSDLFMTRTVAAVATSTPLPTPTIAPGTLDQAWKDEDWPQVITIVQQMLNSTPNDAQLTEKLFSAYFNNGVKQVRSEQLAEAVASFDKALAVRPGDARAAGERKYAQLYLEGSTVLTDGRFADAVTPLSTIVDGNPTYRSAKARLYQAYVGLAGMLEKSGKSAEAYLNFQNALGVDAQGAEAQAGIERLKASAPAQSTSPVGKKIEVDIAKQQVTVWQNDTLVYRFRASTGKAPYLTRKGNFKVLDKMPNAYATSMQWGMPWWMGIYEAGKWENGIHAMARVGKNQTVLSTSLLGTPQTHGCIMLSDKDAKTLYDWAVIGTAVWIH